MAKGRKQDWWDEENAEEIIYVSKSEIKRDAEELKKLGERLVNLSPANFAKMPLDEDLLEALELAHRLEMEARRRQLQYVGKLLRSRDVEPIQLALDKVENKHELQQAMLHKVEREREVLLAEGDIALNRLLETYPSLDRQHLRTLIRGARKEQAAQKFGKAYKEIFAILKGCMLEEI